MQNFWGANKAYHGRCATGEWKFKIERKLAEEMGRGLLLPFSLSVVPYALFFPSPQAPLHYDTKRRVAIVPPWAQKTFPLRIRSLLRSSPRSIPPLARKTSGTKGIGWLITTDISYRISSNNSRPSINLHPRIIAPLEGIFNIIASLG